MAFDHSLTLSAATPGPTLAQSGGGSPAVSRAIFRAVGGTVTFAGSPLDLSRAASGRVRLRKAAIDANSRFAFTLGTVLWDAHDQLAAAYDNALRWRLAGSINNERRA
jgi:hypothetical protein